jgi:glycosyltransferase involved in cell wall biosynthesis
LLLPELKFAVCAMNETRLDSHAYPHEVALQISQEDEDSYVKAAGKINLFANETVVIVQHEYGIFGGNWGELLIGLLEKLRCPVITTLHTVIATPDKEIRNVTEKIISNSNLLVAQTDSSCELFKKLYPSAMNKIITIEHGIHPLLYKQSEELKPELKLANRKVLLTFGLLSRNKGIEHIISAMPQIIEKIPEIIYLVVGGTHPAVIRQEGESYRFELMKLVKDLSLEKHVIFIDDYLPVPDILNYLQASDIYIASSLDPQQAVSGTLSYALGAGRAVISTNFSQAKEIVGKEVGRIVPIARPEKIASAVLELFSKPSLLQSMNQKAYAQTRSMLWSNVSDDYAVSIMSVANSKDMELQRWPKIKWNHLENLTDDFGLLQFAEYTKPMKASGYTLDDNGRALQTVHQAYEMGLMHEELYNKLTKKYLQVINNCLTKSRFVNYLSASTKKPTRQNSKEDLSDSVSRAFYALQTVKYTGSEIVRHESIDLLDKLIFNPYKLTYIMSVAQMLLGASFAMQNGDNTMRKLVDTLSIKLVKAFYKNSTDKWRWFATNMTYANGQVCASLIEAARVTNTIEYRNVGLESLEFLGKTCFMGDIYAPIGQSGWYNKDGSRALFDQQPEDTYSIMQALESAYNLTGDKHYLELIAKAFSWFMGNNLIGARVYDDKTGGCHDGLTPNGVNLNEGAESTISYLNARLIVERLGC